jgi:hypothetical protein
LSDCRSESEVQSGSKARITALQPHGPVRIDGKTPYLRPPEGLSEAEIALFLDLVGSCRAEQFQPSDRPLLEQYVRATVAERSSFRRIHELGPATDEAKPWLAAWRDWHRATFNLSLRLRLSPQGRQQHPPKVVSDQPQLSVYERMIMQKDANGDFDGG